MLAFLHMWNIKFKKFVIFASIILLQPMLSRDSFALAKRKSHPRAFSFFMEGGRASQGECDGERKVPRKLKHLKEYAKANSYLGSETQTFEIKGKGNEEMWKHFFSAKSSCNAVLAKTPSSVDSSQKDAKQELPPEDSADADDNDQGDSPPEGEESTDQIKSSVCTPDKGPAGDCGP